MGPWQDATQPYKPEQEMAHMSGTVCSALGIATERTWGHKLKQKADAKSWKPSPGALVPFQIPQSWFLPPWVRLL